MLNQVQKIEFLGLEIDSVAMKLSLPQEDGGGNRSDVSKCIKKQDNFEGIDPVDWEVDFDNTGNLASQTPDSIFAIDKNKSPKETSYVRVFDYSGSASKGRAVMVDDKHENVQWETSINSSTRYNNTSRIHPNKFGGQHVWEFPQGGNGLIQRKCGT